MSSRISSILAHSVVAGLSVLLTVIVLAQGSDRTVALSPTQHLATQAGPPPEIRSLIENQLSHMASSLSGRRAAGPGPQDAAVAINERVLPWETLEFACEHVKQTLLNQFTAEVGRFEPDPNRVASAPGNRGPSGPSGGMPGDSNAVENPVLPPAAGPAGEGAGERPSVGPANRPSPGGTPYGQAPDPNAGPVVTALWDPNGWADRCACYERIVNTYPDATLKVAVANQIGIFLYRQRQLQDAAQWFARILPEADRLKFGHGVRLNMALTNLELAQTQEARGLLQTVIESANTAEADSFAWGVYLLAVGIMSNIEQVEGHPEPALQHLEQARRRLEALATRLPNEAWPTFYVGMLHVWRLRIAAETSGTGPHPALAQLHREFLHAVPLGRWTWLEHQFFRDALEPRAAPSAAAAAPPAPEEEP